MYIVTQLTIETISVRVRTYKLPAIVSVLWEWEWCGNGITSESCSERCAPFGAIGPKGFFLIGEMLETVHQVRLKRV